MTELVANAWDAGATRVDLILPSEIGGTLTATDDGHGMTSSQFKKRWMTLRYDRVKHQSSGFEFPLGRHARPRKAYGRNGVGRHGLLCFADQYEMATWRDGVLTTFVVGTESGPSPFVLRSETVGKQDGSGTRLSVCVSRKLPDADEILTVLAARFVHDPEFEIRVNGVQHPFTEIGGRLNNHRLKPVGFARRNKVIVDTQGFDSDVEQDWTAFRSTNAVRELYRATAEHIGKVAQDLAAEIVEAASEEALTQNRSELATLGQGARLEVAEFTKIVAQAQRLRLALRVKKKLAMAEPKSTVEFVQPLSAPWWTQRTHGC